MKKRFPVIIVLITLSLLGIIGLQVSWFMNISKLRQRQLAQRFEEAGTAVANELGKSASYAPYMKIPRKQNLTLLPDDSPIALGKSLLSDHFSSFEIKEKLKQALEEKDEEDVDFEFGITYNSTNYLVEVQSEKFIEEASDTINNKSIIVAIVPPETSSFRDHKEPYEHLIMIIPNYNTQVWESIMWMIVVAVLFTLIIITAFGVTVQALLRQKKLSEIKTDFINNMTHEFKTPLATISLAVDALRNEKVLASPEKMQYFSGIIKEENKRMNKHVETILQAALLDKQELKLDMKKVNGNKLVQSALNNYQLQIKDIDGQVELQFNANKDEIIADEAHFTNLLSNLIDNAIKYSKEKFVLKITTCNQGKNLQIKVQDNGIGMNKETTKRIFEKFYRAHTGNIHNVKGFGLGMSYVKTVIDVHKGHIKVDSTLGKGSCFTVVVPLAEEA
jgi:two-component system phosphate regulon sensor histidine kinase PhoR